MDTETISNPLECTLAIIKPDVMHNAHELVSLIDRKGFEIVNSRILKLTPEQVSDFYQEHYGKMFYPSLVTYMSSGPIMALVLAKKNAIAEFQKLIGPANPSQARIEAPNSLRAHFGNDTIYNAFHGSDSHFSAEREIRFLFETTITEPISHESSALYLEKNVNPILIKGLKELCKSKPLHPIKWIADWLLSNNPNQPIILHT